MRQHRPFLSIVEVTSCFVALENPTSIMFLNGWVMKGRDIHFECPYGRLQRLIGMSRGQHCHMKRMSCPVMPGISVVERWFNYLGIGNSGPLLHLIDVWMNVSAISYACSKAKWRQAGAASSLADHVATTYIKSKNLYTYFWISRHEAALPS